jgi:hypothetical protein
VYAPYAEALAASFHAHLLSSHFASVWELQMPQAAVFRKGWENEHLATFLLSRISFVSQPITVGDDVGSDFFCTLFEARQSDSVEMLFLRNSFAIQVKSSKADVVATNKIEYLE